MYFASKCIFNGKSKLIENTNENNLLINEMERTGLGWI